MLAPTPTLVDLARNPERVVDVPPSAVPSLMAQAAEVALAARLAVVSRHSDERVGTHPPDAERLLGPPEAAALLGVTVTWLYRHAGAVAVHSSPISQGA